MNRMHKGRKRRTHVVEISVALPVTINYMVARKPKKDEPDGSLMIQVAANKIERDVPQGSTIDDLARIIASVLGDRCTVRVYPEARKQPANTLRDLKDVRIEPFKKVRWEPNLSRLKITPMNIKVPLDIEQDDDFGDEREIARAMMGAKLVKPKREDAAVKDETPDVESSEVVETEDDGDSDDAQ